MPYFIKDRFKNNKNNKTLTDLLKIQSKYRVKSIEKNVFL